MDNMDLPQELAQMTPEQVESVLAFYGGLPLEELRKRQDIVRSQQAKMFPRPRSAMNRIGLSNLAIDDLLLAEAVFRSQWPAEAHTIDVTPYQQDRS